MCVRAPRKEKQWGRHFKFTVETNLLALCALDMHEELEGYKHVNGKDNMNIL